MDNNSLPDILTLKEAFELLRYHPNYFEKQKLLEERKKKNSFLRRVEQDPIISILIVKKRERMTN